MKRYGKKKRMDYFKLFDNRIANVVFRATHNVEHYNLLRYIQGMNIWQKLILLVLFLAGFIQEAFAAPKKAEAKAPAKKTTT